MLQRLHSAFTLKLQPAQQFCDLYADVICRSCDEVHQFQVLLPTMPRMLAFGEIAEGTLSTAPALCERKKILMMCRTIVKTGAEEDP